MPVIGLRFPYMQYLHTFKNTEQTEAVETDSPTEASSPTETSTQPETGTQAESPQQSTPSNISENHDNLSGNWVLLNPSASLKLFSLLIFKQLISMNFKLLCMEFVHDIILL